MRLIKNSSIRILTGFIIIASTGATVKIFMSTSGKQ